MQFYQTQVIDSKGFSGNCTKQQKRAILPYTVRFLGRFHKIISFRINNLECTFLIILCTLCIFANSVKNHGVQLPLCSFGWYQFSITFPFYLFICLRFYRRFITRFYLWFYLFICIGFYLFLRLIFDILIHSNEH